MSVFSIITMKGRSRMNYKELASQILQKVGGANNVAHVTHCATRLRFNLKDVSKANQNEVKKIKGVISVVNNGGQFQVVIGQEVANVYKELVQLGNFNVQSDSQEGEKTIIANILDTISGIFTPILPALAGSGVLKALLVLCSTFNWVSPESSTYYYLDFISDSIFYFLPMLLAFTAAQKFKVNAFLAVVVAGIFMHPNLAAAGEHTTFFGLSVPAVSYSSSVIPIILTVWVMSYIDRFSEMVSPKFVKFFMKPLITLLITAPIALIIIGPLGTNIGNILANGINLLDQKASWLVPTLLGAFSPLLVMMGMHYSLFPVAFSNMAVLGYDSFLLPAMTISNVSQGGAALAVAVKSKDSELKQLGSSTGLMAILGITEPALYGVNLKLKRPLIASMIGGGLGGLYAGIFGIKAFTGAAPGLLALPIFMSPDNGVSNLIHMSISLLIAFAGTFIISLILGFEDVVETEEMVEEVPTEKLQNRVKIYAPVQGEVIPLSKVNDQVFSQEVMGKGIAIIPTENKVVSPVNGTVSVVFPTGHAIGIVSEDGVELLIHIGLDTVNLNGQHFNPRITVGAQVKVGDVLVEFDSEAIKEAGFDLVTPVIVTNTKDYFDVVGIEDQYIVSGEEIMAIL